jgi:hypothetical protein
MITDTLPFDDLPGAHWIRAGLDDVANQRDTIAACLVQLGSPKLKRCGFAMRIADASALDADHRLYALLGREHGNEAHSRYNALLRELVSFERALEQRFSRLSASPAA